MTKLRSLNELIKESEGGATLIICSPLEILTILGAEGELRSRNRRLKGGGYSHRVVYNQVSFYCRTEEPFPQLKRYFKHPIDA